MKILVTGATGFIGSHLCNELVRRGEEIIALTRSGRTDYIRLLLDKRNFHLQKGDILDADMLRGVMQDYGIKAVFHLAAQLSNNIGNDPPFPFFDINSRGTLNVLYAARLSGVERLIYASTMSVYSDPPEYLPVNENHPVQSSTAYGITKLAGELLCNLYSHKMDISVLRYSGGYGRNEYERGAVPVFIRQALSDKPITVYGDGTQSSDFIYIEDLVAGTILAWEKNLPGVYNIGSGEETDILSLAKKIVRISGSRSEITLTGQPTDRPFRFVLDIAKSRETFGFSPRKLDDGLREHIKSLSGVD